MSHFYGKISGNRGEGTRCGTKASGMQTTCASWEGSVLCQAYEKDGDDFVTVSLQPWHGRGICKVLYEGPIGGSE